MKFEPTRLADAVLIEPDRIADERGFFARIFDADAFAAAGLVTDYPQVSVSHNAQAGTLRGLHFQRAPHAETKLVRCVAGAIWDVILDLRPRSPSYGGWQGFELSAGNGRMLYVPAGFAHGFQTLRDATEVIYHISYPYTPAAAGGLRWDDPALAIDWPLPVAAISPRDAAWPDADLAAGSPAE
jgi:dTDP-4-dehydrorhamnose 3,5-epimerase